MKISDFYKPIEITATVVTGGYLTGNGTSATPIDLNANIKSKIDSIDDLTSRVDKLELDVNGVEEQANQIIGDDETEE
jgi:outer membrane murein-binding lipoprotein Lpp